jgi:O-antigen/teichoic acid export membrane protein
VLFPRVREVLSILQTSKLLRAAGVAAIGGGGQLALALVGSVLFVRYLGTELYGTYQYCTAAVAVIPVFYDNLDQVIVRFFPTATGRQQQARIVFTAFVIKGAVFFFVGTLAGIIWYLWGRRVPLWQEILSRPGMAVTALLLILQIPVSLLAGTVTSTLQGLQRFNLLMGLGLTQSVLNLIWLVVVTCWKLEAAVGLPSIVGGRLVSSFVFLAIVAFLVRQAWPGGWGSVLVCSRQIRETIREAFGPDVRRYVLPLQFTGLMGYLKQYLPGLALGTAIGMAEVTYFQVIQEVFTIVHKFIPNALEFVFPGMVRSWERDRARFEARYQLLSVLYIGAVAGMAFLLLFSAKPLLALWDLEIAREVQWLFLILGVNLIAGAANQIELRVFLFGKDTRAIMIITPIDQLVLSVLTVSLVPPLGLIGAGLGQLARTIWAWVSIAWSAHKIGVRSGWHILLVTGWAIVFILLLVGAGAWYVGL